MKDHDLRDNPGACPYCAERLSGALNTQAERLPIPGDPTICGYCAGLCIFDDDLHPRFPTDTELAKWANDSDVVRARIAVLTMIARRGTP